MKNFLSYFKSKETEVVKSIEGTPVRKAIPERVVKVIEAYRNKNKKA
jgi:hypothetical protein